MEHGDLIASRLHLVWIATVCGKLKTDLSLFQHPWLEHLSVPTLTEKNKADLTRCAEDILLAREAHFPATIADLYDPENMPADLREAHERNDEVLERIYIGRRFRNDTERLEKLFELYTKMTASPGAAKKQKGGGKRMTDEMTKHSVPSVSVSYARNGSSTKANALGMRPMQERAYEKRGEQYLLIKSPPASGKSRALMFIALDKLHNQGLKQAIIVVPEKIDRRELQRRAADQVRLLGRLDASSRNGISATRPARTTAARSIPSARSWRATTRCWSAPMRPSASPWTSSGSRSSTTG